MGFEKIDAVLTWVSAILMLAIPNIKFEKQMTPFGVRVSEFSSPGRSKKPPYVQRFATWTRG